jgi:DHA3 family macrolide efflux protein-like MFS transporter
LIAFAFGLAFFYPDMQGRVFAVRRTLANSSVVLSQVLAGLLAEYVFEPLLLVGGPLAGSVGHIIGVGPGRGIDLLCIVTGALAVIQTVTSARAPRLLRVEREFPDVIT